MRDPFYLEKASAIVACLQRIEELKKLLPSAMQIASEYGCFEKEQRLADKAVRDVLIAEGEKLQILLEYYS